MQNPRPVQHRKQNPDKPTMLEKMGAATGPVSSVFRHIEPTWRNYIFYANCAAEGGDDHMKKVVASYESLPPSEKRTIMPEDLCDLAGVDPGKLIGAVSEQVWRWKHPESVITASMKHPRVIEATADYAINNPFAEKDRELFFRLTGGLPDKKGTSIVINNTPQTANINVPPFAEASGYKTMDQRVIDMGRMLDDPQESIDLPVSAMDADVLEESDTEED